MWRPLSLGGTKIAEAQWLPSEKPANKEANKNQKENLSAPNAHNWVYLMYEVSIASYSFLNDPGKKEVKIIIIIISRKGTEVAKYQGCG